MANRLIDGINGMQKAALSHPSGAVAEVYLNGAHVTSWIPAGGHEMLFLSKASRFEPGQAIRGGVPVVFPQFADSGPLPRHGWLRTTEWQVREADSDDLSTVTLCASSSDASRALWPHDYDAELTVSLEDKEIDIRLTVTNTGADIFSFTAALHTYLSAGDVTHSELIGLDGTSYIDKTAAGAMKTHRDKELRVTAETDRIYLGAPSPLRFIDSERDTSVEIARSGFPHIVVWNPWKYAAANLIDMDDDEYLRMICIEAALVGRELRLEPGTRWIGSQRLAVL
ncbi:MAG: D-hexose-6-phosphate mutarotase [Gemmatimonadaceae bacterium]